MKKEVVRWSIRNLRENYNLIEFPEYQREPNLWSLVEKQRLIDSISRQFDIASLYLYRHDDGSIDCVDGRQRIGAIMSFTGDNQDDEHVNFQFRRWNEIYTDQDDPFACLEGRTLEEIKELANERLAGEAEEFVERIMEYPLTAVMLSDSTEEGGEFNLQFTRLNLGKIINSGEKLHAMVGDLRDQCFGHLGTHDFLKNTNIPTRRFAREQVAAQILAQIFAKAESGSYTRTRHFDLQRIFKENSTLAQDRLSLITEVSGLFDILADSFGDRNILRNRAITVSIVLLARELEIETQEQATLLADFTDEFICRLRWQVGKGLLADPEYHYLIEFQRGITQASAERSAVASRVRILKEEYQYWSKTDELKGDAEWKENNPSLDPSSECRS